MRDIAMDALIDLIRDIKAARAAGASDDQLTSALDFQRKAQFYLDFVEAENSSGFHAPQESVRILGESVNFSRKGQESLRGLPMAAEGKAISSLMPDATAPGAAKWVVSAAK